MTARIPKNTFFSIGFGADDLYDLDVIMFRALQNIDTIHPEAATDTNTCDPLPNINYTTWQN